MNDWEFIFVLSVLFLGIGLALMTVIHSLL